MPNTINIFLLSHNSLTLCYQAKQDGPGISLDLTTPPQYLQLPGITQLGPASNTQVLSLRSTIRQPDDDPLPHAARR